MMCKHCKRDCHPYYHKKYDGFCLDCSNAGVPDLLDQLEQRDAKIAELEKEIEAFKQATG